MKHEEMNKYGLQEYSFEIGPMDDSSETVAIVGIEYSSVSWDEKWYRKEDVDSLIAERDTEQDKRFCRQKYKRCLAMAARCKAEVHNIRRTPLCDMDDHQCWLHEDEFWQRWYHRWCKLVNYFKEAADATTDK